MKIRIKNDVYNISKRIKDIDKNYFIVFNTLNNNFEIHNSCQPGGSYCLTLPYQFLDERTLNYVLETKSENIDRIVSKLEMENKLNESAELKRTLNQFDQVLEENLNKE